MTPEDDAQAALAGDSDGADQVHAAPLIKAFGGIRPMAAKLDVPVSTVQGWKQRDAIPVGRLADIEAAAAEHGIALPKRVHAAEGPGPFDRFRPQPTAASAAASGKPAADAATPAATVIPPDDDRKDGPTADAKRAAAGGGASVIPPSAPRPETAQSQDARSQRDQSQDAQSQDAQSQDAQSQDAQSQDAQSQDAQSQDAQSQDKEAATAVPPRADATKPAGAKDAKDPKGAKPAGRPTPAAKPARSGGGAAVLAFVALIAAIVAVGAAGWIAFAPTGPLPGRLGVLEGRLAAVETAPSADDGAAVDAAIAATDSAIAGLGDRLAALEERVIRLGESAAADAGNGDAAGVLMRFEQRLTALEQGAVAADALTTLADRVATLEQAPAEPSNDAAQADRLAEVAAVLTAVETRLAEVEQVAAVLTAVETRLAEVEQGAAALTAVETRLAEVEQEAAAPRPASLDSALRDSLVGLADRIAALEAQPIDGEGASREALTLFVAAGRLQGAVAAGGPYADELAAVRRLIDSDGDLTANLAALDAAAATGVVPLAALRTRFQAQARAIVRAAAVAAGDGWIDRTVARARAIVSVRRVGESVPGDTPSAILTRVEVRLDANDLSGAVRELAALDGAAAAAAAPWLRDARARLAADTAVAALDAHALTVLEPAGGS